MLRIKWFTPNFHTDTTGQFLNKIIGSKEFKIKNKLLAIKITMTFEDENFLIKLLGAREFILTRSTEFC